jgi:hypothetical protein
MVTSRGAVIDYFHISVPIIYRRAAALRATAGGATNLPPLRGFGALPGIQFYKPAAALRLWGVAGHSVLHTCRRAAAGYFCGVLGLLQTCCRYAAFCY